MSEPIEFAKLSGSGNDFICIDNRDGRFDRMLASTEAVGHFARTLCRRGMGLGADGVIFAGQCEIEGVADIAAHFFEADGSQAELCGNGSACFIHWVIDGKMLGDGPHEEVKILTPAGVARGQNNADSYVRVCIPLPEDFQKDLELTVDGSAIRCDFVVTGVPHAVTYTEDVDSVDVARLGAAIRHHPHFAPRGANANFVQILGEGRIALRTYEFGVEGETLACGTGSAAAAILAAMRFGWGKDYLCGEKPVLVKAAGGDILKIYFTMADDGTVSDVCLETIVRFICSGSLHPDTAAQATAATDIA